MQVSHVLHMLAKIQMMKKQQMNGINGTGKQRSSNVRLWHLKLVENLYQINCSLFTVSTYVLQPPSVEMTIGLLIKIGCLLEGAEMTTGLLISTGHVLQGVAMITGPLVKKTCMLKGDGLHRVLHVQCKMVWKKYSC